MITRIALCLLAASAGLGILDPRAAVAQPAPLGPETRVDTIGSRQPNAPVLAIQPGGDFEIAWSYPSAAPPFVSARHFAADGRPTDAFEVAVGGQGPYPAVYDVTATPQGFEVLWQLGNWPQQPHYRRHLSLQGLPDPGAPPVRLGFAFNTRWVWQVEGNGFLGGWQTRTGGASTGLAVQHLNAATGKVTGPVLRLNSRTVYVDQRPILTDVADGGFLAVWNGATLSSSVLRARLFSPAGTPRGADFDVNSIVPHGKDILFAATAATAPGGGFVVSWQFYDDRTKVVTPYLRFFDPDGRPLGAEIPGPAAHGVEAMAFDGDGNLLVLWTVNRGTAGPDLEIQLFDRDGASLGTTERVASAASGKFKQPLEGSVAWSGSAWIVTWNARMAIQGPNAVFVRRFAG